MDNTTTRILRRLHASFGVPDRVGDSDRQLLERFNTGGDQGAFAALVTRHARTVLAACRHVLADPADVDDAFQATFLVLFKKARGLGRQESIGRWLYAVAHRVAVHARCDSARRRECEAVAGKQRQADVAAPDLSWQEACAILHEELDRLPENHRLPLLLCYLQGQSRDEAAKYLGWSVGALKGRLERGRQALAVRLARRGITLTAGLLAVTAGTRAVATGVPRDLVGRTVRAVAGEASRPVRTLARGAFPGVLPVKRAVASVLLLTALLGFGAGWFAAAGDPEKPQAADKPPAKEKPRAAADSPGARPVSGRVLDPDGKPLAGAKLFVPVLRSATDLSVKDIDLRAAYTTGADGRFTADVTAVGQGISMAFVIAYAPGFGIGWTKFDNVRDVEHAGEITLRLTRDVPVTGRVINTEGQPVPGVSVSVSAVFAPVDGTLDNYFAAWKRDIYSALTPPKLRLFVFLDRITGPVTTDRDGRFTLRGAGAERIAEVLFAGGGVARSVIQVVTRPGFDPKPYNDLLSRKENEQLRPLSRYLGLHAPDFTFVAEPGRQLTGTVTDAVTGEPVAGCQVSAFTNFGDNPQVMTDARGRYRLDGIPKSGCRISVTPPPGSDYLSPRATSSPDAEGISPIQLDVQVLKGIVVTGRVVDTQTGKGVRADVRAVPLPANKPLGTRPDFSLYAFDRSTRETDAEGKFRLVTIPGPALVTARVSGDEKLNGQLLNSYRRVRPDPAHKDLFQRAGEDWQVITAGGLVEFLGSENAVKVVDVAETGQTAAELLVDRGVTGKLAVQDADGRPLAGARVAGLTAVQPLTYRLAEPTATVYALEPDKPRNLVFYHPERHLGGTLMLYGGAKEPGVAKLGPLARLTGRVLDADGQPIAGATVSVNPVLRVAADLYQTAKPGAPPVVTDKAGRFTLAEVVPGVAFSLMYRKDQAYYRTKGREPLFSLKPGENRDAGDRTIEPRQ